MRRELRVLAIALILIVAVACAAQAAKEDIVLGRSDGYVFLVNGTDLSQRCNTTIGGPISLMAVEPNGDVIVVGPTGWVYLLDRYDLSTKAYCNWGGPLKHIAMQPNGNFVVANDVGTIYTGNGQTVAPTGAYAAYAGYQVDCLGVIQSTGDVVATLDSGHAIRLDGTTLAPTHSVHWGSPMHNLAVRADGQFAVTLSNDTCYVGTPDMSYVPGGWVNWGRPIVSMEWRPDNNVYILTEVGNLFVRSGNDMTAVYEGYLGSPVKTAMRPDGSLTCVNPYGTAYVVDSQMAYSGVYYPLYNTVTHMVAQNNGDTVMVTQEGDLWIARAADLAQINHSLGYDGMTHLALQPSLTPLATITDARKSGDGAPVLLTDVVVSAVVTRDDQYALPQSYLFGVEAIDRSEGVAVLWPGEVTPGTKVVVEGRTATVDGQRVIQATSVTPGSAGTFDIKPVGMCNQATAGGAYGKQGAVLDDLSSAAYSVGINNVGLLLTTWGTVTASYDVFGNDSYFYIDDGSGLIDGSTDPYTGTPNIGMRCGPKRGDDTLLAVPAVGTQVRATGIMGVHQVNGLNARYLWTVSYE